MSTLLKGRESISDTALTTIDQVERLGFTWKFDYEYPVPTDASRRLQVRRQEHNAPGEMVTQFAAGMTRGDKFPPPVFTLDGFLADGNTRMEAARRNKYPTTQAVIVQEKYEGASESVRRRLHILGAAFNARHGKRLDRAEIAGAVHIMAADRTYDANRIAALIGVPDGMVRNMLTEKRARDRAAKAGVTVNGSVPATQLRKLGGVSDKMNDAPWLALLALTQDAGLSSAEVGGLIVRVKGVTGSDDDRITLLEQERQARREQIAEFRARGKARPSHAALLRQRLGFILGYQDSPSELVEHSPNFAAQHRDLLVQTIELLGRVLDGQGTD